MNDSESYAPPAEIETDDLGKAREILLDMLRQHEGCVSTRVLRRHFQAKGIRNVTEMIAKLKFYEPSDTGPGDEARHYHRGRSFYSEEAFRQLEENTRVAADAEAEEAESETLDVKIVAPTREYRQDEARLVTYVKGRLDDVYATEFGPECEYVFDVHNDRAGSGYENVDLVAVHWRSDEIIELVTVEVKLDFNVKLVQQAANYIRFSDRVWIAMPVAAQLVDAAAELRELDPLLFEHIVELGMGILACRRGRGGSFEVVPVHWPRLQNPARLEKARFLERHRGIFEEACIVAPRESQRYPKMQL